MSVVDFHRIHHAYERGNQVLRDVSFTVERRQVLGLLGKNGAGKTTLLRLAMGLLKAQEGEVRLLGLDPRERPLEVKLRVGYVSEDQILPPALRVRQVLDFHRGVFPTWDEEVARRLGERFEIPSEAKIKTLSRGQVRQVALLCAIAHRPELLILDEPAGGLDPAARREFLETSIQLLNEAGSTILFSSHYMSDVERLADRIVMLHDGGVLVDSELDELRESYSLAMVPAGPETSPERLRALAGCTSVRRRGDSLHLVFELEPQAAESLLERELGIANSRCSALALEEMFIELVGGQAPESS